MPELTREVGALVSVQVALGLLGAALREMQAGRFERMAERLVWAEYLLDLALCGHGDREEAGCRCHVH